MWVEETKNGKFKMVERYEDYLTGQTKRVSVTMEKNTTQSRKLAQKALETKIEKALSKSNIKINEISLKTLVNLYHDDQTLSVKSTTCRRNSGACKTILNVLGENIIVNRITAKYVRDKFLATQKEPGTLNELLKRFKSLMRWGYMNDLVDNISFLDKIPQFNDVPRREKIQDKFLERDELRTLITGMNCEVWKLFTEFLALSGLRIGEAISLEKKDVNINDRLIYVSKTLDYTDNTVTAPKTQCSIREVYIQNELKTICSQINKLMLRRRLMFGIKDCNLFLFSEDGSFIHYDAYRKYLKENSIRLIGRQITPHALRHTHASLLLAQEIPIESIQRRLGHENSRVTREIYLHITEELKKRDNDRMKEICIL